MESEKRQGRRKEKAFAFLFVFRHAPQSIIWPVSCRKASATHSQAAARRASLAIAAAGASAARQQGLEQAALLLAVIRCQGRWRAKRLARRAEEAQRKIETEKQKAAGTASRPIQVVEADAPSAPPAPAQATAPAATHAGATKKKKKGMFGSMFSSKSKK